MSSKSKKKKKEVSVTRKAKEQALYDAVVPQELIERAKRELVKERCITPFMVAQRYSIKLSSAKKLLRILWSMNIIEPYNYNRRVPIFVPKSSK